MGPPYTLQYAEIRDGAASHGPVRLQLLAQYQQRHRNAQRAGVGPSAHRRANTRLCMMYRVAHTPVGNPWTPWLTFTQRTTRGSQPSHAWKYIPISTSHDAYKFSFLPHLIAWNQLPSITTPSLEAFRSRLITLHPTVAIFIVLSPPCQLIMLAQG